MTKAIALAAVLGILNIPQLVSAAPATAILSVPGLDCFNWPRAATSSAKSLGGVAGVKVDVDRRQLRFGFDDAVADPGDIVRVLRRNGFAATLVEIRRATGA